MNYIIGKVSWLFEITCGTTGPESMVVVGNIFLGQTESPLLVQPYLEDMSESEIFVVMCSGLASVAGSVMGAFIAMGVSPGQLKHKYTNGIYSLDYGYIWTIKYIRQVEYFLKIFVFNVSSSSLVRGVNVSTCILGDFKSSLP